MEGSVLRVKPLSGSDRKQLGSMHPELRDTDSALVISGSQSAVSAIEEFVRSVARDLRQSEKILEVLMEEVGSGVLEESHAVQLQRLAAARSRFLAEFPTLTSQEIAELNGSRASNSAALAHRWKAAGRIFALNVARVDRYPAFQLGEDGKPLPVIARILEVMADEEPWTIALWFVSNSGWLKGKRPVDLLRTQPDAVVDAARRATAPLSI